MATAAAAPERITSKVEAGNGIQQGSPFGSRQVACAFILLATDVATIGASVIVALLIRTRLVPHLATHVQPVTFSLRDCLFFCSIWLVLIVFLAVEGLYTQRRTLWNEIGHVLKAVTLGVVAIFASLALTKLSPLVSRATIVLTGVTLMLFLPVIRYWAKWILGKLGPWRKRMLVIGAADAARLAIQGLLTDPVLGYEIAGVLDDDPGRKGKCLGECAGIPIFVLGSLAQATEEMTRTRARDILIAMPDLPEEELVALVQELQPAADSVYVVPHLWGLPMMNLHVDGFLRERVMMLKLFNNLAKPWNQWLKRSLDLILGSVILLVVAPICIVVAILIKLDSEGPALFIQDRIGHRGKTFPCMKFRTMRAGGEELLLQYLERNPAAAHEWRTFAKLREYDPRVTRIGRFLRRWSLDELPQFINVVRGEMSIIGPRPYLPGERSRIGVNLSTILSARPGVTGFWQVNGRNNLSFDDRVQLEAWYVRNWTLWLDSIVLAKTFRAVLLPRDSVHLGVWSAASD